MPTLPWSDSLVLNQPSMDATHREFVALLASLEAELDGAGASLDTVLDALVEHTESHFAQEEHWMLGMGLSPQNCHSYQHAQVLKAMHEVLDRLRCAGDVALVRQLAAELAEWFPAHAHSMDAGLSQAMAACGYDPAEAAEPARGQPAPAAARAGEACTS